MKDALLSRRIRAGDIDTIPTDWDRPMTKPFDVTQQEEDQAQSDFISRMQVRQRANFRKNATLNRPIPFALATAGMILFIVVCVIVMLVMAGVLK